MAHALNILVVEDDPNLAEAICEVLSECGYRVMYARNGAHALELLDAQIPHLILLDLMMPVMNGWEFRERQRRDPRLCDVPVLVLSALEHAEHGIEVARIIRKPVRRGDLLAAVENLLPKKKR